MGIIIKFTKVHLKQIFINKMTNKKYVILKALNNRIVETECSIVLEKDNIKKFL